MSDRYFYGVPSGATYDLHVSRENHVADTLTFKPSPVLEQEADSSSVAGQDIGAESGWYTLHNPDIGDSDGTGGEFDSSASYTTIQGYGDGTVDKYTFAIVATDLKKPGGTTTNVAVNAGTYYLTATMTLAGPVDVGDQWVVTVDGTTYTYPVASGDTITQVANGLKAMIPAKYNATVATGTPTMLSLSDATGFTLASPYINHANSGKVIATAGSSTTKFSEVMLDMSGTIEGSSAWRVLLNGVAFDVPAAASLTSTVAALRTLIDLHSAWTIVSGGTTSQIRIRRTDLTTFTAQFQQEGLSPVGRVVISGTPDASTRAAARWTSATISVTAAHNNETLNIVVNGTTYTAPGSTNVSTLISSITTALASSGVTVSSTSSSVTLSSAAGFSLDYSVTAAPAAGDIALSAATWTAANLQLDVVAGHSFNANDLYRIVVDGTPYTAKENTRTLVGNDLRDQLNATLSFTATYDSGTQTLSIRKIGSTAPSITASVVAPVNSSTSTANGGAGIRQLTVSGTITPGETFLVVLGGSIPVPGYVAVSGDTPATVAAELASLIGGVTGYSATSTGGTVDIDDTASTFRPAVACTIVAAASPDATVSNLANSSGNVAYADLSGSVVDDEVWTLTVAGLAPAVYPVSGSSNTLADVAAGLMPAINAGGLYAARYSSGRLTIVRLDSAAIGATKTVVMPVSVPLNTSAGTLHEDWSTTVGTLDAFVADDVFTLQLTTETGTLTSKTYPVVSGDDATAVFDGLKFGLSTDGYTASVAGGILTISRSDRQAVTVRIIHHSAAMGATTTADTLTHYDAVSIVTTKSAPPSGKTWVLKIDGAEYTYKTRRRDSMSDVVSALVAKAVLAGWTAAATTTGTDNIPTIRLQSLNGVTVQFEEGNGTLTGLLDIDRYIDAVGGTTRIDGLLVRLLDQNDNEVTLTDSTGLDEDFSINPLKTFTINTVGTYTIQVYAPGATLPIQNGVPAGTLYRLNVSLPGHAVSTNQVNLAGKTITFTYQDSSSVDQTAVHTIESYDPETSTYTLTEALPATMPVGTRFTIGFDIGTVYPQYTINPASSGARIDTYTIVLTAEPAAGEIVRVDLSGIATRTYNSKLSFTAGNGEHNDPQVGVDLNFLEFTAGNWNIPQSVTVTAVNDSYADGQDAQVFVSMEQRVNRIRGPVIIEGGNRIGAEQFLNNPVMLPGETNFQLEDGAVTAAPTGIPQITDTHIKHFDPATKQQTSGFDPRMNDYPYSITFLDGPLKGFALEVANVTGTTVTFRTDWPTIDGIVTMPAVGDKYFITAINFNLLVNENTQVDVLNVYNSQSPVDDAMTLTADRLTGLGMGPDTFIGGEAFHGGIDYTGLEAVNIHLGTGSQDVTVRSTHTGETSIISGKGNDTIRIRTISGRTYVNSGTGTDAVTISGDDTTLDQITGLLTVAADGTDDTLDINDSADDNHNSGTLTATTLTGLDMPSVAEVQTMRVQATGGSFRLSATGLTGDVSLNFGATAAEMTTTLTTLFSGSPYSAVAGDITVIRTTDGPNSYLYTVSFVRHLAGQNLPTLVWVEAGDALTFTTEISKDVRISTVADGHHCARAKQRSDSYRLGYGRHIRLRSPWHDDYH